MLIRLYSDTGLIDSVTFHRGINIILGKYSEERESRGINGIGKSSLIRLINFVLLSRSAEEKFNQQKYNFLREEEHNLTLEFEVKGRKFFIKRSFSTPKTVLFGNLPDKLVEYEKSEIKEILEGIFFPTENDTVFFEGNRYGTLMNFFVKDDLQNQQRVDPLNFLSHKPKTRELALYNFFLLNLPTKDLIRFNEVLKDYEEKRNTINGLSDKIKADTGKDIKEFRSEILKIEEQIRITEESLKSYNFFKNHKDIEKRLSEVIEKINEESLTYHATNRKLEKLKKSYSEISDIDLNKIQQLYNDTLATFGDFVKKNLDEVIEFKKQLLLNRNKYLLNEEKKLDETISKTLKHLSVLEKKRSMLFSLLREKGVLDRVENTYEELIKEKTLLERNTAIIKEIDDIEKTLLNIDIIISELKRDIINEINKVEGRLNNLRLLFQDILKNAIYLDEDFENSYFDITTNPSSKRDQLPFSIDIQIPKADALGQERLKIVAYDLMVFLQSRIDERCIPDFLIHDGVFHAISRKTILNVLNYIYHKANEINNFQYILTFNEDEIDFIKEMNNKYGELEFDISEHIVAQYSDTEENTLFKRFF